MINILQEKQVGSQLHSWMQCSKRECKRWTRWD